MRNIKTQTRLILLMGIVILVFLAGLISLYRRGEKEAFLLLEDKAKERASFLNESIELYGGQLKIFVYDYSYWDDMVSMVTTADSAWGYENIYLSLNTYHVDVSWVYRPNGQKVYNAARLGLESLLRDKAIEDNIKSSLEGKTFHHYFCKTQFGLLEIRTAPIQPSSDNARETPPQGYFVSGIIWDSSYIANIGRVVQARISVIDNDPVVKASGDSHIAQTQGTFRFSRSLNGLDGRPIAWLDCEAESPIYKIVRQIDLWRMIYIGIFSIVILVFASISLHRWVSLPLRQIMSTLQKGSISPNEKFKHNGLEFCRINELVLSFFAQKASLEAEIAERKQAEETLKDSESLLRATLESTADGILVVINGGLATHWNKRFSDLWRIPEYIINTRDDNKMLDFVLSQLSNPKGFISKVDSLYASSEVSYDTIEFLDGRLFERYSCPLVKDGKIIGRVWSFTDGTERKKADDARLELAEKLERAQRMESLGILAGGVAHDLNNILSPILGYSELLLRALPNDSKIAPKLRKIADSAENASAVIQDLLTLARRGRYEMKLLDFNDVITGYLQTASFESLKQRYPQTIVRTGLSPEIGIMLGSEMHLGKVVMNLITNAFEAMPTGGTLDIKTERSYITCLQSGYQNINEGDYIILRIKDTGYGIAEEDIKKIFEPYFSKKKMGLSGSGLGLSIVYGIVKDHKGYHDVLSQLGMGTEFILYFPASSEIRENNDVTLNEISGGSETVLIVDDSAEQRELAGEIVSSMGYTVYMAENGSQAVKFISQRPVDIVMLDMIMEPDFDGLDTYREILKIRPNQKAIVVSGYASTDRVQLLLQLGAGGYIKKPYKIDVLAKIMRDELDKPMIPA
jgi:signal transduction histidine kinase/ActR/RegA family two-component response regulator